MEDNNISNELQVEIISNKQQVADIATTTDSDDDDDDDDEEGFVDAIENVSASDESMLLLSAADETSVAFRMFVLEDKFDDAVAKLKPLSHKSIYHSVGVGILYYTKAFMTFEPSDIESAVIALKESADICNARRHRSSITNNVVTKMIIRPNYDTYTDDEVHAELSYASCLFLRACLSFFQDSNFISFIRGGLRIRTSYQILKECECILENRKWSSNELRKYFKSAVCYGSGCFNLMISSLPKRIMKLLQFIGFSGDKETATQMLDTGNMMTECYPGLACTLINLFYHTVICCVIGCDDCDFDYLRNLLHPLLKKNPTSTLLLYFSGRIEHLKGNVREAIDLLQKSIAFHVEFETFRQFSYWELYFCHIVIGEYRGAIRYVDELKKGSNWSKAIYTFFEAAALCMCTDRTDDENEQMSILMKQVPELRKRLAGKSFPPEKYVEIRSRRFFLQDNWLLLPAFEMMYVFNYLSVIKNKIEILDPILARVNRILEEITNGFGKDSPYFTDNYCLALFLKGVCLSYMGSPLSAEQVFVEIYENRKNILEDHHIISCTLLELGIIYKEMGNYERAIHYLHAARKGVAFYAEFRIHHVLQEIKLIAARCKNTATTNI